MEDYLITLNVPPGLEDAMVDKLLLLEAECGFSSFRIAAHHHQHQGLSLREQVSGYQQAVRFQIHVAHTDLEPILLQLRSAFTGAKIHYWVTPIIARGVL